MAFPTLSQAPGAMASLAPRPRFSAYSAKGPALLEATADSGLGLGKNELVLHHPAVPEPKDMLKELWGQVRKPEKPARRGPRQPNRRQFYNEAGMPADRCGREEGIRTVAIVMVIIQAMKRG